MDDFIRDSRIVGTFIGYGPGRVYRLDDGSCWIQESATYEFCYMEDPPCRLIYHKGTDSYFLDVIGTATTVNVSKKEGA